MADSFQTVGIVGLGLIGASTAWAMKTNTDVRVLGWDQDEKVCMEALHRGVCDEVESSLSACDLIILALYPSAAVEYIKRHQEEFTPGTMIVDFCGIKRYLKEELETFCESRDLHYLGAHPMAGRETSGIKNALCDLFKNASLIITPSAHFPFPLLQNFKQLMYKIGFKRIVTSDAEYHDKMIAYTSQLAHILSSAYIQNPLSEQYNGFTGGSFQDLTRVSRLNSAMWSELFLRNRDLLCQQLDILMENLKRYKEALSNGDEERLCMLMENGTRIKNKLLEDKESALKKE